MPSSFAKAVCCAIPAQNDYIVAYLDVRGKTQVEGKSATRAGCLDGGKQTLILLLSEFHFFVTLGAVVFLSGHTYLYITLVAFVKRRGTVL